MQRKSGWVLAGLSAIVWVWATVVAFTFTGVTGPAIFLGWLILFAAPLTVTAVVLLRSGRARRR